MCSCGEEAGGSPCLSFRRVRSRAGKKPVMHGRNRTVSFTAAMPFTVHHVRGAGAQSVCGRGGAGCPDEMRHEGGSCGIPGCFCRKRAVRTAAPGRAPGHGAGVGLEQGKGESGFGEPCRSGREPCRSRERWRPSGPERRGKAQGRSWIPFGKGPSGADRKNATSFLLSSFFAISEPPAAPCPGIRFLLVAFIYYSCY